MLHYFKLSHLCCLHMYCLQLCQQQLSNQERKKEKAKVVLRERSKVGDECSKSECKIKIESVPSKYRGSDALCNGCDIKRNLENVRYSQMQKHWFDNLETNIQLSGKWTIVQPIVQEMVNLGINLCMKQKYDKSYIYATPLTIAIKHFRKDLFDNLLLKEKNQTMLEYALYGVAIRDRSQFYFYRIDPDDQKQLIEYFYQRLIIVGAPYYKIKTRVGTTPQRITEAVKVVNEKIKQETNRILIPKLGEPGIVRLIQDYLLL